MTRRRKVLIGSAIAVAVILGITAITADPEETVSDDPTTTTTTEQTVPVAEPAEPAPVPTVDEEAIPDLDEVEVPLDVAVDAVIESGTVDMQEFCEGVAVLGDDLGFEFFEAGFDGAAEPFGFSDRQVYDEFVSRC